MRMMEFSGAARSNILRYLAYPTICKAMQRPLRPEEIVDSFGTFRALVAYGTAETLVHGQAVFPYKRNRAGRSESR